MKFKLFTLIGIILLFGAMLIADEDPILISVPYDTEIDQTIYETTSVLHITKKHVIAEVLPSQLSKLTEYAIIDNAPWTQKYFLISNPKKGTASIKSHWGEEIFAEDNLSLIKADKISSEEIINDDYVFVELHRNYLEAPERKVCPKDTYQVNRGIIDDLIALIEADSIESYIQTLQDFQTRYAYADTRDAVAQWLADKFMSFGIVSVEQDSFYYNGIWHKDVIAVVPENVSPDEYIFIGGHHDSIVHFGANPNPMVFAPGADDNGSSTAGVLEMARVIMEMGYEPDVNLVFCTFGAEEIGLVGSHFLAQAASQMGLDLRAMINADMIANNTRDPGEWLVDVYRYTGAEHLYELALQLIPQYTTLSFGYSELNSSGSDSYPFWINGYDPVYFFENEFSPYYHSNQDLLINCDIPYCTEIVKLQLATLISLESMPPAIANYHLMDVGNGSELYLDWSSLPVADLDYYEIGVGTISGIYTTTYTTKDTTFTLAGLTEGQLYYVGVAAVNTSGTSSFIVEKSLAPESLPRMPENFVANPEWFEIELTWSPNPEMDLDGYDLYRSESQSGPYEVLNTSPLQDTLYTDADVTSGQFYYYYVQALDGGGNISTPTDTLKSRAVTLDQGILLVDDTKDGNGTFMNPTEAECDAYYDELLDGYTVMQFDTYQEGQVSLAQLGAYSTVYWYIDDATGTSQAGLSIPDIEKYLDFGGQLLLSGFKLTEVFAEVIGYPRYFDEGSFCYDYLKLNEADMDNFARFYYADPIFAGFEALYVDTTKTLAAADYHIFRVESVTPNDDGISVYNYESLYEDTSPFGVMNGMPVGTAYFGVDHQAFTIPVPFYYIRLDDARTFIDHLFQDYFGETVGIDEPGVNPSQEMNLYQNYPNPIKNSTTFTFSIPDNHTSAKITIYNLRGQLVNELSASDPHSNEICWDGKDRKGNNLANGIYFYHLTIDDEEVQTRKLVILK